LVTIIGPSKKIVHCANVCFNAHAIAPSYRQTPSKAFEALEGLCKIYLIIHLECCKCTRMRFHYANALVVLRSCAP